MIRVVTFAFVCPVVTAQAMVIFAKPCVTACA